MFHLSDCVNGSFHHAKKWSLPFVGLFSSTAPAGAHVSEQGFVLLLPTDAYIFSGVATVVLTIAVLLFLPLKVTEKLSSSHEIFRYQGDDAQASLLRGTNIVSLAVSVLLLGLLAIGYGGSRDPLANPLPLFIWTVWWIGLVSLHGFFGNLWSCLNPWTGIYNILSGATGRALIALPNWVGRWPAVLLFMLFFGFAMADPAPDDPTRLAVIVGCYWALTLIAMLVFGKEQWLSQGECFTIMFRHYADLAPFQLHKERVSWGWFFGWRMLKLPPLSKSGAVFVLILLGSGSFDGLNETFWWLAFININPLEFPGRSAIIGETITGLLIANGLLILVISISVALGMMIAGHTRSELSIPQPVPEFSELFGRLTYSILPIAFGYHIAHYFTGFLVNIQYAVAALSDPFSRGDDYLGLGTFYVTTGFFNSQDSVRLIWLTQAAFVVAGHVVAILMAHGIAVDMYRSNRRAIASQLPLCLFMIAYTLLGLWLLASPRGA